MKKTTHYLPCDMLSTDGPVPMVDRPAHSQIPLPGHEDSQEHRAAEGHVVQRVDYLRD